MNIINIKAKQIFFFGDLHGAFGDLAMRIRSNKERLMDSCVFICGDIGAGFPDSKVPHLRDMRERKYDDLLKEISCTIIFVRGNHDDPDYFSDEYVLKQLNTDNFIFVPDYTMVNVVDGKRTTKVLCIGGGASIDKAYRIPYVSYWPKEMVRYVEIPEFKTLDILCTHAVIDVLKYDRRSSTSRMIQSQPLVLADVRKEYETMQKIFEYYKPKVWYHGHHHCAHTMEMDGTTIIGLCELESKKHEKYE